MTTNADKALIRRQLVRDGQIDFFYRPPAKATYYNKAGVAMPNLPADPHSMARYFKKGFTLTPPAERPEGKAVAYPDTAQLDTGKRGAIDTIDEIIAAREAQRKLLAEEAARGFEAPTQPKKIGLACPEDGCEYVADGTPKQQAQRLVWHNKRHKKPSSA